MTRRVLVCGGRDYHDPERLWSVLDALHQREGIEVLITGGAPGADRLGWRWAVQRRIPRVTIEPDWRKHGKAAGPIRNRRMLWEGLPDLVLAFPGGTGTADMTAQARAKGVEVREIG